MTCPSGSGRQEFAASIALAALLATKVLLADDTALTVPKRRALDSAVLQSLLPGTRS